MAEDRWKASNRAQAQARRLARTASGVRADRLRDVGHDMPVGVPTLLALLADGETGDLRAWAEQTYSRQVDVATDRAVEVLTAAAVESPCSIEYRAVFNPDDPDLASWVLRASGESWERWTGRTWESVPKDAEPVGYRFAPIGGDTLTAALAAIAEDRAGVVFRPATPRVLLPRRIPLTASLGATDGVYATVDEADTTAVLQMLRVHNGRVETRADGQWEPAGDLHRHLVAAGVPVAAIPPADVPMLLRGYDDHEYVYPTLLADAVTIPNDDSVPDGDVVTPDGGISGDDGVTPQPDFSDGVMVALPVAGDVAQQLAVPDGLSPDEMHVTLAYLGNQDDVPVDAAQLAELVAEWASGMQPFQGEVSGPATFEGTDNADNPVQVALVDSPDLPQIRQSLVDHLESNGVSTNNGHGFTPHITRQYGGQDLGNGIGGTPLSFDSVSVHHGPDRTDIPLGAISAAFNPSEARDPTGKWTAGQSGQLESSRKVTAPHAAPKAPHINAKLPKKSAGGGGGASKAAAEKAQAAKKAGAIKAAQAKKTTFRNAALAQEKAQRDTETATHQKFLDGQAADLQAEQQRHIDYMHAYAGASAAQRKQMRVGEAQRQLAWRTARSEAAAKETARHTAAQKTIAADKAKTDAKLKSDLAAVDAALAKQFPPMGTPAPAKAPVKGPVKPLAKPVKASADPMVSDAVPHTRTPDQLREYWVHGKGAARVQWGRSGDWSRCVRLLSKYVHNTYAVKGQCNELHKLATGLWTSQHAKLDRGGK